MLPAVFPTPGATPEPGSNSGQSLLTSCPLLLPLSFLIWNKPYDLPALWDTEFMPVSRMLLEACLSLLFAQ